MSGDPRVRASDADRERTAALLREHHAVGRLTPEEFSERVDKAFAAKTLGDLEALLSDLPAIDLYQLPAAGIRPTAPGGGLRRRGGPGLNRRGDGGFFLDRTSGWITWMATTSLLLLVWFGVGLAAGGVGWLPWFLLIVIPWAQAIARRPPDHP
ncbi:MAG TPA: DUF1707 domain-containing protein [Trebonia sp.]|jgi:hypothetical protein|nr:DUF1707 domain-containing protein [Trebonia sp.]